MRPQPPYIYAETAFHHEGDLGFLFGLVAAAKEAGVSGVKFQGLLRLDQFASSFHKSYATLEKWLFSRAQWLQVIGQAQQAGLDVIWMPLDHEAVALVKDFPKPPRYLEIHSVSFYDRRLLEAVKATGVPLIISAGGR